MKARLNLLLVVLSMNLVLTAQNYPDNELDTNQDMLHPEFYQSAINDPFRITVNKFIFFARADTFHHPLMNDQGDLPDFVQRRGFGDVIGGANAQQHHPAIDLYVGNRETSVDLYAPHDGLVRTYRDAPKYRHYLSITKELTDSSGVAIGKIVTLLAHLDIDLDEGAGLLLNNQLVKRGDLVSKHLYAETMGGPHLHLEIRYYRPDDAGTEEFYGLPFGNADFTELSAGPWSKGYWHPDVGYGFGDPVNHFDEFSSGLRPLAISDQSIMVYPNPAQDQLNILAKESIED